MLPTPPQHGVQTSRDSFPLSNKQLQLNVLVQTNWWGLLRGEPESNQHKSSQNRSVIPSMWGSNWAGLCRHSAALAGTDNNNVITSFACYIVQQHTLTGVFCCDLRRCMCSLSAPAASCFFALASVAWMRRINITSQPRFIPLPHKAQSFLLNQLSPPLSAQK